MNFFMHDLRLVAPSSAGQTLSDARSALWAALPHVDCSNGPCATWAGVGPGGETGRTNHIRGGPGCGGSLSAAAAGSRAATDGSEPGAASWDKTTQSRTASRQPRQRPSAMFAPFRKATRVVSLEVTGSFFALFALPFALGVWHQWGELRSGSQAVTRFALLCGVTAFFGYCSVSSFVRARRLR